MGKPLSSSMLVILSASSKKRTLRILELYSSLRAWRTVCERHRYQHTHNTVLIDLTCLAILTISNGGRRQGRTSFLIQMDDRKLRIMVSQRGKGVSQPLQELRMHPFVSTTSLGPVGAPWSTLRGVVTMTTYLETQLGCVPQNKRVHQRLKVTP